MEFPHITADQVARLMQQKAARNPTFSETERDEIKRRRKAERDRKKAARRKARR